VADYSYLPQKWVRYWLTYAAFIVTRPPSSSYDRYWEGRKAFASLTSTIRNLSRAFWVNVAAPPKDSYDNKGKTQIIEITPQNLHRRKIDALHLCMAFPYAAKHYLRGEDGIDWDDYYGLLPTWFIQIAEQRPNSYSAVSTATTHGPSLRPSLESLRSGADNAQLRPDATKRIRVKRSKPQISVATTPRTPRTPLIQGHNILSMEEMTMPLPLMLV
jgi:ion channel-forming bestrophin family protein